MGSVQHHCCPQPKMGDAWAHRPWPGPPRPALLLVPLLVAAGVIPSDGGASCPVLCTCHNQAVDCSGQRLFSVPPELPVDTRNLSLAHNRIAAVPPGYLTCYRELRVLSLRNNSLVELPAGLFLHAKRLAHLDLSYNNLSHVPAGMFQAAHSLMSIDLSHNPGLHRVHPRAFQGLAQLRDLDLSFGGLAFLSLEALEGLPGLVTLQIGGNPWVCGCTMEPLLKWLRNRIQRCTAGKARAKARGEKREGLETRPREDQDLGWPSPHCRRYPSLCCACPVPGTLLNKTDPTLTHPRGTDDLGRQTDREKIRAAH